MNGRRKLWLWLAGVIVLAAPALWWGWNRYFSERANPSEEDFPVRGIDISAHNGEVDFERIASGGEVDFAYVKATEGTDFIDRRFTANVTGLRRYGIPAGAYHFFRFDTDGEMQGWNFISALRGRNLELRPAIDVEEWANAEGESTSRIMRELRTMLDLLRREGYNPVIYTNKDGYNRFVKGKLDGESLWLCSFTDPPLDTPHPIHLWQYTHRGSTEGIEGAVDFNAATDLEHLMASTN